MTRDLWLLAASAVFAIGSTFLAGSWHVQPYTVAPTTTNWGQVVGADDRSGDVARR